MDCEHRPWMKMATVGCWVTDVRCLLLLMMNVKFRISNDEVDGGQETCLESVGWGFNSST